MPRTPPSESPMATKEIEHMSTNEGINDTVRHERNTTEERGLWKFKSKVARLPVNTRVLIFRDTL